MLQTKKPNLHHAMKYFGEHYGFFINKSLNSSGPVFNTRYQSKYIHDDRYLLQVLRYIHLNPVEANIIKNYKEYVWSSIHDYLEERFDIINPSIMKEKFLNKDDFLAYHELGNSKELNFFYNRKKSPGILSLKNVEKVNKNKKT